MKHHLEELRDTWTSSRGRAVRFSERVGSNAVFT